MVFSCFYSITKFCICLNIHTQYLFLFYEHHTVVSDHFSIHVWRFYHVCVTPWFWVFFHGERFGNLIFQQSDVFSPDSTCQLKQSPRGVSSREEPHKRRLLARDSSQKRDSSRETPCKRRLLARDPSWVSSQEPPCEWLLARDSSRERLLARDSLQERLLARDSLWETQQSNRSCEGGG